MTFARSYHQASLRRRRALCLVVAIFCLVALALTLSTIERALAATPPGIISYQGRLLDDNGVPLTDATAEINFEIFDGPDHTSDTCLWSNDDEGCNSGAGSITAQTVTLTDGLFSENLGDTSAGYAAVINNTIFGDHDTLYLAVTVNGELLSPLKRITAQMYALNSSVLQGFAPSQTGGTAAFVTVTDSNGRLVLTGDPQGSGVSQGMFYVNPTSGSVAANDTLFGLAVSGSSRFRVDGEGDTVAAGTVTAADFSCTDCLDFPELADSLTLDAATNIATAGFAFSTSGSGAINFASTGQVTMAGNVDATSGLDVTGANLTVGAANFSVSSATGNVTTAGDVIVNGDDITSDGSTLTINAGGTVEIQDNLTITTGTTISAASVTTFNCTDCANFDDLADNLTLDAATSIDLNGSNLTFLPSGAANYIFDVDGDSNLQVTNITSAATTDMITVTNAGLASSTNGVDALAISFAGSNSSNSVVHLTPSYSGDGSGTYNAMDIDGFTATTSTGTDTINGIRIGALTEAGAGTVNSTAINLTTGWDNQIAGSGFTVGGGGATTITPTTNINALSVTGTNVSSSNLVSLDTRNVGGSIVNLAYGAATTQIGSVTGLLMDLSTNLTGGNGTDVTNISLTTLGGTRIGTGTEIYSGLNIAGGSALVQNTAAGTINWRGVSLAVPAITQTTGTVTADGLRIALPASSAISGGGTMTGVNVIAPTTSGPTIGTLVGVNIAALTSAGTGTENAVAIGGGWDNQISGSGFTVAGGGATTVTPGSNTAALTVTGTNITSANLLSLNALNTSGTLVNIGYSSSTTQAGALTGINMNLNTNLFPANGQNESGMILTTTGGSFTGSGTENIIGFDSTGPGITQSSAAGTVNWAGYRTTLPTITQTTGTVVADGLEVVFPVSGAITTGGSANGVRIIAPTTSGPVAGTLTGINVASLTSAGLGTENAIGIGTGWDNQILASGFTLAGGGATTITPTTNTTALTITGTNITSASMFSVDSRNTTGTIINVAYGAGASQGSGSLTGMSIDLATSITGANGQDMTALALVSLGGTRSGSGTENINTLTIRASANLTQSSAAGTYNWRGVTVTMPAVTQTTGTLAAHGLSVTLPDSPITTGGTVNGITVVGPTTTGATAGILTGVNVGSVTNPGAGTEVGISIGDGWDNALNVNSGQMTVSTAGVVAVGLDNTATTSGLCHSGADVDVATNTTRDVVACSAAPDDYAEWYDSDGTTSPGDVVALTDTTITYTASQSNPYTGQIVGTVQKTLPVVTDAVSASGVKTFGIVSTSPIQVIGSDLKRQGTHPVPIALSGRVPLHVIDEGGAITPGDPLTPSATPGYAMKAVAGDRVIATALGSLLAGQSTIEAFVRYGNSAVSESSVAQNTASLASGSELASLNMNGNVYLNGHALVSVGSISGLSDHWSIAEDGTFVTKSTFTNRLTSVQGNEVDVYATTSPEVTISLSGTATLHHGQASVHFAEVNPDFAGVISTVAPIRVLVTANGPTGLLYVSDKNHSGFSVQEVGESSDDVTFDYLVIAYRNGYEPAEALDIGSPEKEPESDVVDPSDETSEEPATADVVDTASEEALPTESTNEETPEVTEDAPVETPANVEADAGATTGEVVEETAP